MQPISVPGSAVLPFRSRTSAACSPRAVSLGHPAEREQRPTDGAGGSVHEHWLASFYPGGALTFGIVVRTARREGYCPGSIFGFLAVIAFTVSGENA